LARELPTRVLARLLPAPLIAAVPVRTRSSTLSPRVKETEE
jgi:hypothetical protein